MMLLCAVKRMISVFLGEFIPSDDSQTLNAHGCCCFGERLSGKTSVPWANFGKQNWRYGMNHKCG